MLPDDFTKEDYRKTSDYTRYVTRLRAANTFAVIFLIVSGLVVIMLTILGLLS